MVFVPTEPSKTESFFRHANDTLWCRLSTLSAPMYLQAIALWIEQASRECGSGVACKYLGLQRFAFSTKPMSRSFQGAHSQRLRPLYTLTGQIQHNNQPILCICLLLSRRNGNSKSSWRQKRSIPHVVDCRVARKLPFFAD